jgi:hypothetical protein
LVEDLHAMALAARLVESEIEIEPAGRAGGEVDRPPLLDRACRRRVVKTLVEVIDHPQPVELPAGAVHELHLECNLLADPRCQRTGDVHEHGILCPRRTSDAGQQAEDSDDGAQPT